MAQQKRAETTREAIIAGAAEVFDVDGFGGASLSDIVEKAGVTKGSLYFHFASKELLALAVIEAQHEISFGVTEEKDASGAVIAMMVEMCRQFGRQLQSNVVVRAGIRLTLESSSFNTYVVSPYLAWMKEFESLIRQGVDSGEIRNTIDPEALARFVIPAFTGVQMVSQLLTNREDVMKRIDDMWEFLLPTLRSETYDRGPANDRLQKAPDNAMP